MKMFNDLRDFIEQAERIDEVRHVDGADWDLEIGALSEAMVRPDSPVLLFDNITDYPAGYRVCTNLVTSRRRVSLLWDLPESASGVEMVRAYREKYRGDFKPVPPRTVKTGPVLENVHSGQDVNLFEFPVPRWNAGDGGRYIGVGNMVITRDPDSGWVNLGTYRVQAHESNVATIQIDAGHHGDVHRRKHWAQGKPCPAVVTCGQEPVLFYAANTPTPSGVSEYDYAGWMRGEPVDVVRGDFTGLPIPATAEIALEGEIMPPEVDSRTEGPFGEYTGYYAGLPSPQPVFRVHNVLHRNNPILHGNPPLGTFFYWWDRNIPRAAIIWDMIERTVPGVQGVWIMDDTAITVPVISIKQSYAGQAKQAAIVAQTFPAPHRFIIVVDEDVDPSNIHEVMWAMGTRFNPETIDIIRGVTSNIKDPITSPEKRAVDDYTISTAIFMACKPFSWKNKYPRTLKSAPELLNRVEDKWPDLFQK
jgi:UbiD family decarboxylase